MNTVLGFKTLQLTPTAIAQSNPVTVTVANHGLLAGQFVRATQFYASPARLSPGMLELNNQLFQVGNITTNTFDLFDIYRIPIDGTNFVPFVNNGLGQFTLTGEDLFTQNLNSYPPI